MKRTISILTLGAVVLLLTCACVGPTAENPTPTAEPTADPTPNSLPTDVRNARWGMTKDEVKAVEKENIIDEEETDILFNGRVSNKDCNILYSFNDKGELYRVALLFEEAHTNPNRYISDYNTIKEGLIEKYGKPELPTDSFWDGGERLYKDNPSDYGMAVLMGYLQYLSTWDNKKTSISLSLRGVSRKANLIVTYESKKIDAPKEDSDL